MKNLKDMDFESILAEAKEIEKRAHKDIEERMTFLVSELRAALSGLPLPTEEELDHAVGVWITEFQGYQGSNLYGARLEGTGDFGQIMRGDRLDLSEGRYRVTLILQKVG